jgi:putative 2OG-Fe(II) oxygenase
MNDKSLKYTRVRGTVKTTEDNQDVHNSIKALEKDGFVMFRNFFSEAAAAQAYSEINSFYQKDLEARRQQNIETSHWQGPAGYTILTEPTHLMIDVYTKSPALDLMFEKFLTDPQTKPALEMLTGPHIKLRGYNVRRMTGSYNPPPAHEWHRDSLGEIGFGILLTDVEPEENGATSFVPGSHLFPYCPRWNNLFYVPTHFASWLVERAPINRILGKKVLQNHTGAHGKRGDAYIFINDTWHGRQPNLHGKEAMVVLIGAYPTDYNFPDKVTPPSAEILAKLPPNVAAAASTKLSKNTMNDTILRRMIRRRESVGLFTLWRGAQLERRLIGLISNLIGFDTHFIMHPYHATVYRLKKFYRQLFPKTK